jgi:hypothetical protein
MLTPSRVRRLSGAVRDDRDLRREAFSMSLYVAIILLSALMVFDDANPPGKGDVLLLELGTTIGLVLAHGFASWVSAHIVDGGDERIDPADLLLVQLAGATFVGSLAAAAVILAPTSVELVATRLTVVGTIGILVFAGARRTRSLRRAAAYGLLALLAGIAVASIKSILVH